MPSRQSKPGDSSTAVIENGNIGRERVFDAFRQWGYLEADLDPLGFLQPVPHPDLQLDSEFAQEARGVYCGTVGAEFMHMADAACRRLILAQLQQQASTVVQLPLDVAVI